MTVVTTSLLLCSCAINNNIGFGFDFTNKKIFQHDIVQKENPKTDGVISIEYESSYIVYSKSYVKLKDSLLREPSFSEGEKLASETPKGGLVSISILRGSIEAANTKYFEFVVFQDEIEIYRADGRDNIASVPRSSSGKWRNYKIIYLDVPFENNLKVYVIDKLFGGRDEFIITRPNNLPYSQPSVQQQKQRH